MKLSIQMHTLESIGDWVAFAQRAEEVGLAEIRLAERIDFPFPTWPTLFMMAQGTERIELGTGVTNPYSRHPAITAKMAAFLDNYSKGRAVLGVGQGDLWQFGQLGIKPERPLQGLREGVQVMRHFLSGEEAAFEGEVFSAPEGFNFPFRPYGDHLPIAVGTRSPGGMAVAGEVADELHLPNCIASEFITVAQQQLEKGLKKAGRNRDDIMLASSPQLSISKDRDTAVKHGQEEIAFFIEWMEYPAQLMGLDMEEIGRLGEAYRKGDSAYLHKNIDQRYQEAFGIIGTPADVIEQIERLADMGIEHITFNEPGPNLEEALTLLEKEVLPHFAG